MNTFKIIISQVTLGILLISGVFLINWNYNEKKPTQDDAFISKDTSINIHLRQNNYPFRIQVSGDPMSDMQGDFRNSDLRGRVLVTTERYDENRETIKLRQTWTLHPPEPIRPVKIQMSGTMNLNNNRITLTGQITSEGRYFKKNAEAKINGTSRRFQGGMSIGGKLMFNPQPEPPAQGR
jgi:hypothetical protein